MSDVATSPRGLLESEARSELVETWDLDGVYHVEDEQQDQAAWFAKIRSIMAKKGVPVSEFPPADLEYLCTLVDGISGPGLPYYQFIHQYDMLSLATEGEIHSFDEVDVAVDDDIEGILTDETQYEGLEVALCVKIGRNDEHAWGGSFILWCRRSPQEDWRWRYMAHIDEESSDTYGTVEEYLAFYAHHNEQSEGDVREDLQLFGI